MPFTFHVLLASLTNGHACIKSKPEVELPALCIRSMEMQGRVYQLTAALWPVLRCARPRHT
jgi:hypothetical protein